MESVPLKTSIKKQIGQNQSFPILHIIKSLGRGGAETLLPETLAKHDQGKYQFHYIYFLPWKNQMVKEIENAGGIVSCIKATNNLAIIGKVFRVAAYVRKNNIRLIHCHLPWAGILARMVGRITGVPVVYTEHNKWERYHKLTYHLNKITFSSQDKVIAVSSDVANSIKTFYRGPRPHIQVVLNGINTEKYSAKLPVDKDVRKEFDIPSNTIVIGLACVFRIQKRLHVWLEIAKKLHEIFPDVHFLLVGDGPLRSDIESKARLLNTENYVHFAGLQSEIRPYLKAIDIFMMSSEFEGLPIALLEAMSMECMPACTAAGGIPELIADEQNGLLVPVDDPFQLVSRLTEFILHPSKIKLMGQEARNTVKQRFSMQQMVGELEGIYDNLLKEKV